MYTNLRYTIGVRDGRPPSYASALPSEPYPGAGVLSDLRDAPPGEMPRVLARFAVLRAWLLRPEGDAVAEHALSAARAHLEAESPGWAEAPLLAGALDAPAGAAAWSLLERAAAAADGAGHVHGGRALRTAVHRARFLAARLPPPSAS